MINYKLLSLYLGGFYHTLLPPVPGICYKRPRYTTVRATFAGTSCSPVYLSCIHLSPKYSNLRLEDVKTIHSDLKPLISRPHLWVGDFNALSRSDYTELEWDEIAKQRVENGRQPLCSKVTQVRKRYARFISGT